MLVGVTPAAADEDSSALLIDAARDAMGRKRYDDAARDLDRALAENPRRIDAYVLRASVHTANRERDAAVALLRRARELAPKNLDVLSALGAALIAQGKDDEGAAILEDVVKEDARRYEAHALLAHRHLAAGEPAEAAASIEAYLASRPEQLAGEDRAFRLRLGEAKLRAGDPAAARALFARLVDGGGDSLAARLGMAWATAATDCKAAAPLLDALLPQADAHREVYVVKGLCALALGDVAEARRFADRAGDAGHALKGEALLQAGDARGAIAELERAPAGRRTTIRLARAQRLAGDAAGAAARLEPMRDDADSVAELGQAWLAAGKPAPAAARLGAWVAAHPDDIAARGLLGEALLARGDADAALPHLEAAAPSSARARALVVDILGGRVAVAAKSADWAGAESLLLRARAAAPDDVSVRRRLAAVRLQVGHTEEALAALGSDEDAASLHLRGRALSLLGQHEQARRALEKSLALDARPEVALDLAADAMAAGDPVRAVAVLGDHIGDAAADPAAFVAASRAAARTLLAGAPERAQRLLERAEKIAPPDVAPDVRCELAVAATAAGDRAAAQRALRGRPRCPGDLLAILTTAASGDENAFRKLTPLARKSRLAAEVASLVASRIAADAYAAGHPDKARRYLAIAGKGTLAPKAGVAIRYDQALLDLDAGRDGAAAQLEALAGEVPEAWIALALAAERKGDPVRSLAYLRKAADAKVDFPPLKEWIHAKARLLEETP